LPMSMQCTEAQTSARLLAGSVSACAPCAAGANGNKIERANGNTRTATREPTATRERQQEDDAPHPGGDASTCQQEAAARPEAWLLSTRGAELRKAKSLDTALRSMAHVTNVWSLDATQPAVASDPTRHTQETTNLRQLRLPDAGVCIYINVSVCVCVCVYQRRWVRGSRCKTRVSRILGISEAKRPASLV